MHKTAVIVPALERRELTERCLDAVRRNTRRGSYLLVLVDNGSQDRLDDVNCDLYVRLEQNQGFARGCNAGAKQAMRTGVSRLVFLNNDTEVAPGWLPPLVSALNKRRVGIAGAFLHKPGGAAAHAGVELYPGAPIVAQNVTRELPSGFMPAVTGACLAITAELFERLHGFDDAFYNGYEDVDLCLRAREAGYMVWYEHQSQVMHLEAQSGHERWAGLQRNIELLQQRWNHLVTTDDRRTAILIPAMRAEKLQPMVERVRETTRGQQCSIHFMVARDSACARTLARARADDVVVHHDGGRSWGKRLNDLLAATDAPYVFCGADDVLFWDGWLEQAHRAMGTMHGVCSVNDKVHEGVGTLPLVSRRYIEHYSGCFDTPEVIIYPGYRHNYSETEMYETAKIRGRWTWAPHAVVEHRHPINGKAEWDKVYSLGTSTLLRDEALFNERADRLWRNLASPS